MVFTPIVYSNKHDGISRALLGFELCPRKKNDRSSLSVKSLYRHLIFACVFSSFK